MSEEKSSVADFLQACCKRFRKQVSHALILQYPFTNLIYGCFLGFRVFAVDYCIILHRE
jgi:hypothetical protein